ncbi:MAG: AAA family ATPase [Solirubrobacteraceae bacterium]
MTAAAERLEPGKSPRAMLRRARSRRDRLPVNATIVFAEETKATGIDAVLAAVDRELVGLAPVKQRISEIAALLMVDRVRQRFGLAAPRPSLHMCFTGSPGTGKTTVGLRMADLLHRLGYLEEGHLVAVMRDDLVGQFVGQTAPRTRAVLNKAMGGVLFIDEAYHLYREDSGKDYGQEAIEILLQVMENERDKVVVILAGYEDRMDTFFSANPGLSSRVAFHLSFADYDVDELDAIGRLLLGASGYFLSDDAAAAFRGYLEHERGQPKFANGRTVRNLLEAARFRHANRLVSQPERAWDRDDLMRIDVADLLIEGTGRDAELPA